MIGSASRRAAVGLAVGLLAACGTPTRVVPTEHVPEGPVGSVLSPSSSPSPARPPVARPRTAPTPTATRAAPRRPPSVVRDLARLVVVVDAGHGGVDPGASARSIVEKSVALDISRRVADGLRRRGATVHMTRDKDVKIPLDERAAMADRVGADLLVSIHADAAENKAAHGVGVWIARQARRESVRTASAILAEARRAGLAVRSVHRADFRVLVGHARPSVLVETGFLSNADDARLLAKAAYRARVAGVIVAGVARAFR